MYVILFYEILQFLYTHFIIISKQNNNKSNNKFSVKNVIQPNLNISVIKQVIIIISNLTNPLTIRYIIIKHHLNLSKTSIYN